MKKPPRVDEEWRRRIRSALDTAQPKSFAGGKNVASAGGSCLRGERLVFLDLEPRAPPRFAAVASFECDAMLFSEPPAKLRERQRPCGIVSTGARRPLLLVYGPASGMDLSKAVKALEGLAQASRLKIFRLLVPKGAAGMPAGEIAKSLKIPPATLSFHLSHLANAGLVESRREGRTIYYALRVEGIRPLVSFLIKDCCQGRPDLCAVEDEDAGEVCTDSCAKPRRKRAKSAR